LRTAIEYAVFTALAIIGLATLFALQGPGAVVDSALGSGGLLLEVAPLIAGALLVSAYMQLLVSRERIARLLGDQSGLRGLLIACIAGALTPGGPFAAFPLVVGFYRAGVSLPLLVTYITAWSLLGLQRALVWELPILGHNLMVIRYLVALPLPLIAGLIARRLVKLLPDAKGGP